MSQDLYMVYDNITLSDFTLFYFKYIKGMVTGRNSDVILILLLATVIIFYTLNHVYKHEILSCTNIGRRPTWSQMFTH